VRRATLLAVVLVLGPALSATAQGGLTILAPAAPGGGWDQTARALQRAWASVEPDTNVQVDNVSGAAGTIGLARFVQAERGNPSALMVTGLVMVSGIVTSQAPVSLADCVPIARLTGEFEVIVVPSASPYRTLADLVAAFRANPGAVAWGGGSAGGTDDLLVRLLAERVGVEPSRVTYIAFAGGGAMLPALMGEQVAAGVGGFTEFGGQIEAGHLRLLAVSSPSRVAGIAAPTIRESGIDLEVQNWRGVVAPPGISESERDALAARLQRIVESEAWRQTLQQYGWADLFLAGAPFRQFLLGEQARVEAVLQRLGSDNGRTVAAIGPAAFPAMAVMGTLALGLLSVGRLPHARVPRWPGLLMAALFVQPILMPLAGFVVASAVMFALTARAMGSPRPLRDVLAGLVVSGVLFVAFTRGLGVPLP
jgi:putative tricarboxylic transport membrane protein